MALTPLASVEDLSDWLGEPITEALDVKRAGSVLAAASALVRSFVGKTWMVLEDLDPALPDEVAIVTTQVAARGYSNPEGWASESIDDWRGGGRKIDEAGLFLTASERSTLGAHKPSRVSGIGVMATTRMPAPTGMNGLVPTDGGTLIPWY